MFNELVAFLSRTAALSGAALSEEDELHIFPETQQMRLDTEHAGFFVNSVDCGRWVHTGDELGTIYDASNGTVLERVHSPWTGIALGMRTAPEIDSGDTLAIICCTA